MFGAIIGDIVGSRFEFNNHRSRDFELLTEESFFTDDTVMTIAVADAILRCDGDWSKLEAQAEESMHRIGRPYPGCGYGGRFWKWMYSEHPAPYNSFGNGSAMRVSAVAWAAGDLEECKRMSHAVTCVTHNHPEGLKGAECTAVATWMALHGASKEEIIEVVERDYYKLDFTLDGIRSTYRFNETCQDTVPQAMEAFRESTGFISCVRNAISVGGDSDTLAAIACAVAEAYYGIPNALREQAAHYLDRNLLETVKRFESVYGLKEC